MEVAEVAATRRRRALRQLGRQGDEDLAAVETLDCRDRCLLAVEQDMAGANLAVGAAGRPQSIVAVPQRRGGERPRQMTTGIGRGSGRGRGCQEVVNWGVAVSSKQKTIQ